MITSPGGRPRPPPGSSARTTAALMRLPTGSRCTSKLRHTAITISSPCWPTPVGSGARISGSVVLLSHTVTSTAPSPASSVSRHGPGAYLRALVTSSLTTSWTTPIARADAGSPCTACNDSRNSRAIPRAAAMSSLPSNAAETDIARSTTGCRPPSRPARSIQSASLPKRCYYPPRLPPKYHHTPHTSTAPTSEVPLARDRHHGRSCVFSASPDQADHLPGTHSAAGFPRRGEPWPRTPSGGSTAKRTSASCSRRAAAPTSPTTPTSPPRASANCRKCRWVEFDVTQGQKGPQAENIRPA